MAIFKCKMCGGSLEVAQDMTVYECEYCGSKQTLPRFGNERKDNLYDRANHFRRNSEYDKAMGIYEQILEDAKDDAESYWSIVLCRYGIEYVEDPATHKRVPTINRVQTTSVFDDENYKSALKYADIVQKEIYESEARAINEIQKDILEISQKEEPFDVFICYKEADSAGRRTPDSVLANDLYHQLIQEGFKVFFSRITLEDKIGSAYEPYIFAALNSAKVMVVLGTKPEYFNAVWVKNEWSRYLALIKNGEKKILVPAYRDMDPYDLPEEFSHLQAQDMSKLGFMQDLIRGIKKIMQDSSATKKVVNETVVVHENASVETLLKRAFMFLEDGNWDSADEYCERVLDVDPENAEAYLGKLMVEQKVRQQDSLADCWEPFEKSSNYIKAHRFGTVDMQKCLENYCISINNRIAEEQYQLAIRSMKDAINEDDYRKSAKLFSEIENYADASDMVSECLEMAEQKVLHEKEKRERRKKKIKRFFVASVIVCLCMAILYSAFSKIQIERQYTEANIYLKNEEYDKALSIYEKLGDYKEASSSAKVARYYIGISYFESGDYELAKGYFGRSIGQDKEKYIAFLNLLKEIENSEEWNETTNLTELYHKVMELKNDFDINILLSKSDGLNELVKLNGTEWGGGELFDGTSHLVFADGRATNSYEYKGEKKLYTHDIYYFNYDLYYAAVGEWSERVVLDGYRINISWDNQTIDYGREELKRKK